MSSSRSSGIPAGGDRCKGRLQMDKEILREMIKQNRVTSHFSFDRVTEDNAVLRLNEGTASIGFIYRHVGETINLFAQMLGTPTDVTNTTIGQTDVGQQYGVGRSEERRVGK